MCKQGWLQRNAILEKGGSLDALCQEFASYKDAECFSCLATRNEKEIHSWLCCSAGYFCKDCVYHYDEKNKLPELCPGCRKPIGSWWFSIMRYRMFTYLEMAFSSMILAALCFMLSYWLDGEYADFMDRSRNALSGLPLFFPLALYAHRINKLIQHVSTTDRLILFPIRLIYLFCMYPSLDQQDPDRIISIVLFLAFAVLRVIPCYGVFWISLFLFFRYEKTLYLRSVLKLKHTYPNKI